MAGLGPFHLEVENPLERWAYLSTPELTLKVVIEGVERWIPIGDQEGMTARELVYELDGSEGRLKLKIVCHRTPNTIGERKVTVTLEKIAIPSRTAI